MRERLRDVVLATLTHAMHCAQASKAGGRGVKNQIHPWQRKPAAAKPISAELRNRTYEQTVARAEAAQQRADAVRGGPLTEPGRVIKGVRQQFKRARYKDFREVSWGVGGCHTAPLFLYLLTLGGAHTCRCLCALTRRGVAPLTRPP